MATSTIERRDSPPSVGYSSQPFAAENDAGAPICGSVLICLLSGSTLLLMVVWEVLL